MEKTPIEPTRIVWPSGSDLATNSAAIAPFAPGLFSTTAGWPSTSWNFAPIARPTMSEEPPATNGMTMCTGLVGQACACAPNASAAAKQATKRRFIGLSPGRDGIIELVFPHAAEEEAPRGAALAPLVWRAGPARL